MRSHRWRSIQSGLPESAHGSPELVKHALLVEVDGMSRNSSSRRIRLVRVGQGRMSCLAREVATASAVWLVNSQRRRQELIARLTIRILWDQTLAFAHLVKYRAEGGL